MRRASAPSSGNGPTGRSPSASSTAQLPQQDYGQGWRQLTSHGKIYISSKEKNVFVLEGKKAAGFAACCYDGGAEERALLEGGTFSLQAELKCVPGEPCPDQQIYLLLDCLGMADLSSGCDFCGVSLRFDARELRVESHRKNATTQVLFAQPGCSLLRPQSYVTLALELHDDVLSLRLGGISLIGHLPLGRTGQGGGGRAPASVGVAVYGRSRCYLNKFKVGPAGAKPAEEATSSPAAALGGPSPAAHHRASASAAVAAAAAAYAAGGSAAGGVAREEMDLMCIIERDIVLADLKVRFEDIGGLADAKRAINEALVLPLLLPDFFTGLRRPWKGVLLFGPPGTGKTMLAKAVASCTENVTFFNCSSATLTSKWRGESEKLLRTLFVAARARVPAILFFDEIDSLLSQRGSGGEHEASRRFKSEFLIHMDGLLSDPNPEAVQAGHLLVLATSNAPWDLDEALRRRLEKRIYIPLPDEGARLQIIQQHLKDICLADDVDLPGLATLTERYSGADIQLLCRDASMNPMRRLVDGLSPAELVKLRDEGQLAPGVGQMPVSAADFQAALLSVQPSVGAGDVQRHREWAQEFGSK